MLVNDVLLVVLVHGNHGFASDWNITEDIINDIAKSKPYQINIKRSKSNEWFKTHDGIDVCGERFLEEMYSWISDIDAEYVNRTINITFICHSLGSLIVRYACGKLYDQGIFDKIVPHSFISLSAPLLGSRRPKGTWWNNIQRYGQHCILYYLFGRTGSQLLLEDDAHIIKKLSNPAHSSMIALKMFKHRTLVSIIDDNMVPHASAALNLEYKPETLPTTWTIIGHCGFNEEQSQYINNRFPDRQTEQIYSNDTDVIEYDKQMLHDLVSLNWKWIGISANYVMIGNMSATDVEIDTLKREFPTIINEILHQMEDLTLDDERLQDLEQTVCAKFFDTYTSNVDENTVDTDLIGTHIIKFKEITDENLKRLTSMGVVDTKMFTYCQYTPEMFKKMCKTNPYTFIKLFGGNYYPLLECEKKILYQYHPKEKTFDQYMEIGDEQGSISVELTIYDDVVLLQNVIPEDFLTFIFEHNEPRYIFIPVTLTLYSKKTGHQTMLIFDNFARTFYYFDPNGKTDYFHKNANSETNLHEALIHYINKELGLDYTFTSISNATSFNTRDITSYTYDCGHCVAVCFMMVHLLRELTEKTPDMIVNHLETFSREARRQLTYNFTANMCKAAKIMSA